MKADSGGGGGDGHGAGHSGSDGVLVLPPMPPLPDGRADLWAQDNTDKHPQLRLKTHLIPASSRLLQASLTGVVTGSTLGGDIHVITSIGLLLVESVFSNEEETPFFLV